MNASALLLLVASLAASQPTPPVPPVPPVPAPAPSVAMPANVTAAPNRAAFVTIAYTGDAILPTMDAAGSAVDMVRQYDPRPGVYSVVITGDPGVYLLHAVAIGVQNGTAVFSAPGTTAVTLQAAAPPVPPTPPVPPPTPIPVSMTVQADAVQASLRTIYGKNVEIQAELDKLAAALKRPK